MFKQIKDILAATILSLILSVIVAGQVKTNDVIARQIKETKSEKTITLNYDAAGNASKIIFFSEDFGKNQYEKIGLKALSFGISFFYAGKNLTAPPPTVNLTFWIQTKKPKFAEAHRVTIFTGTETLDLGEARYVSKPNENMEYLNFVISREILTKVVSGTNKTLKIGNSEFNFTPAQLKSLTDFVKISDPTVL